MDTDHGPLILRNRFIEFADEHRFGCHTTALGFTGEIDTIEIWILWLILKIA